MKKLSVILLILCLSLGPTATSWAVDANTHQLTDIGSVGQTDEFPVWSISGATTKKANVVQVNTGLFSTIRKWVGMSSPYDTFANAVTALNADGNKWLLELPPGTHIGDAVTVNSNITLRPLPGANITISNGATLTINGPFDAGLYQIFTCTGTGQVVFGPGTVKEILPEWWGAISSSDSAASLNAAIIAAAVNKQTVLFSQWYQADSTVNIGVGPNIRGVGMYACGIDSRANGAAITGTGKWAQQVFQNFGLTQENNGNSGLIILDAQYGAKYCLFENLQLTGKAAATQDGFVIRGLHPTAGANANQFSNLLLNIRTATADTEISGCAIKLYGTATVDTRCNNNSVISCCPGGFATGIYVYGQNNRLLSPVFNSTCSTAGVWIDDQAGGGTTLNILDAPYFDTPVTFTILITNETNSDYNRLLAIRNAFPQGFTTSDVVVSGTHTSFTIFSLDEVWYKTTSPSNLPAPLGTRFVNLTLNQTWIKTGPNNSDWSRYRATWGSVVAANPGEVPAGGEASFDITPTAVPYTANVVTTVNSVTLEDGLIIRRVYFDGSVIKVRLYNYTGAPIDPASQNWRYLMTEY